MDKSTPIHERHWQTQALIDAFVTLAENQAATYEQLAAMCKVDVAAVKRRLQGAKKVALSDHHVIIETIRKVGVVRLAQAKVTVPVERHRGRMRSAARRGIKLIEKGVTDWNALDRHTKSTLFMERAVFGATVLVTDQRSRRVLKEHAETTNAELNIGRTLELVR